MKMNFFAFWVKPKDAKSMKTIEEINLTDIEFICRYFDGELNEEELRFFRFKFRRDEEFRHDYELVLNAIRQRETKKNKKNQYITIEEDLLKKTKAGNHLINNGLMIFLTVTMMLGVCCAALIWLAQ